MIVGNGDIASVLKEVDRDDLLFFASGVSNSQETKDEEYMREISLIYKQNQHRHIVYFSTLALFYSNTRYTQHKKQIENIIKRNFPKHTIVRIGNITWGNNPHTIINFFRNAIEKKIPFEVRDEWRYIVDKEEFLHWIKLIPDWPCEINIPGRRMKVADIVKEYGHTK